MSDAEIMSRPQLLAYWRKVKETIHLFDKIIVQYVIQWSAVLLGIIGASVLAFSQSRTIAGVISLTAILVSLPIALKCFFYYELLEEALSLGKEIEKQIFRGRESEFGLTHRLCSISTRRYLEMTFFGWTIFIPFAILAVSSLTLALFYFDLVTTPKDIVLVLFALLGGVGLAVLLINFFMKFAK